ncbi:NTP transferase domain-containing protein [uncultured Thalassospira sp.]|uniref:cytidylyltransferase domain-containing protein n=1 Tax=uncultured Thalassospira sp. TaxID=404382 RepID=UPI0032B2E451
MVDTGVIVFARMGSARFPGKMLFPLLERPLLGHVLDRAALISGPHQIVVATSKMQNDDAIEDFVNSEGIRVYRGPLEDVATRALDCCKQYGFSRFVRICGDRPFMPWDIVNELLYLQKKYDADLATNACTKTFPGGTMSEVVKTSALQRVIEHSEDAEDREHLTRYIYRKPELFSLTNIEARDEAWRMLNLAIDEAEDVARTEWIMRRLGKDVAAATIDTVVNALKSWEEKFKCAE